MREQLVHGRHSLRNKDRVSFSVLGCATQGPDLQPGGVKILQQWANLFEITVVLCLRNRNVINLQIGTQLLVSPSNTFFISGSEEEDRCRNMLPRISLMSIAI